MICLVSERIADRWLLFEADDLSLLRSEPIPDAAAIWVISLNHKRELFDLLYQCGVVMLEHKPKQFYDDSIMPVYFRSDNATVMKWAERFGAYSASAQGHRNRYCIQSAEFTDICIRAFRHAFKRCKRLETLIS